LLIGQSGAAQLIVGQPMKVMDVQVFVPFAFGVPEHRGF
jgi:hypothetical protein